MNSKNRLGRVVVIPLLLVCLWISCLPAIFPTGSALGPGESLPELSAAGWLNGDGFDPSNLSDRVLVIVAFASW